MDFITGMIKDQASNMLKAKVTEVLGENIAKNINVDSLVGMVAGQLGKNSETEEGAKGLMDALDKHTNEGVNIDLEDGKNILGHLFGGSQKEVEAQVAKKSNISESQSKDLLALVSSFVMENLGNEKAAGKVEQSQLSGLSGLAKTFMDQDKDGSIIDDLFKMGKKFLG